MSILIIHPYDKTTFFLKDIIQFLKSKIREPFFEVIEVAPDKEAHENCKKSINELTPDSTIIFFGHGASFCLVGAKDDNFYEKMFLKEEDSYLFKGKNVFFLACKSSYFIRTIDSKKIFNGIGFGDLPTEWEEVLNEREIFREAFQGVNENILERFKIILVEVIKFTLYDAFLENLSFKEIYLRLRARFNKQISHVIIENKNIESRSLSNLIYDVKSGLTLYSNKSSYLFS